MNPLWQRKRLKFLCSINPSKAEVRLDAEAEVSFVPMERATEDGTVRVTERRRLGEVYQGFTYFRDGDVLVAKITPCFENGKGGRCIGLTNGIGFGSTEFHVLRAAEGTDSNFLFYVTRADHFRKMGESVMYGAAGQQRVPEDFLQNWEVDLPPLSDQRTIAAFLDHKTAEIDAVVAKKERMIDLLREEREALISHTVEARENRSKAKLAYYTNLLPGYAFPSADFSHNPDDVRLLRGINVTPQGVSWEESVYWCAADASAYAEFALRQGDLVFGMDRPKISSGIRVARIGSTDLPALLLQRVARLRATSALAQDYLELLLRSNTFWGHLEPDMTGVSVPHVSPEQILSFEFWLPTIGEQHSICSRVTKELHRIDVLIGKNEQQIDKLREYRQTLISAAVTGKIAVTPEPVVVAQVEPAKKPNPYFRRTVFAAEVIARLGDEPTFGHVKFQKAFFVAQHHLRLADFEENYHRMAAGPHDNQMIRSVDKQLAQQKWFTAKPTGGRYVYERMEKAGGHRKYFDGWFGSQEAALAGVLELFRTMTTEQAEIVATLYAAWNDALLLGEPADDDRIIEDVLTNWNESKQKISRDRWQKALDWMREKKLIPHGFGKPTRTARPAEERT